MDYKHKIVDLIKVRAEETIKKAVSHGIKEQDARSYLKNNVVPDLDADSLIMRMHKSGALDSYEDVNFILDSFRPRAERRRTEAELD